MGEPVWFDSNGYRNLHKEVKLALENSPTHSFRELSAQLALLAITPEEVIEYIRSSTSHGEVPKIDWYSDETIVPAPLIDVIKNYLVNTLEYRCSVHTASVLDIMVSLSQLRQSLSIQLENAPFEFQAHQKSFYEGNQTNLAINFKENFCNEVKSKVESIITSLLALKFPIEVPPDLRIRNNINYFELMSHTVS